MEYLGTALRVGGAIGLLGMKPQLTTSPFDVDHPTVGFQGWGAAILLSTPLLWCNSGLTFSTASLLGVDALVTGSMVMWKLLANYGGSRIRQLGDEESEVVFPDKREEVAVPALLLAAYSYWKARSLAPYVIDADSGLLTRLGMHVLSVYLTAVMCSLPQKHPDGDYLYRDSNEKYLAKREQRRVFLETRIKKGEREGPVEPVDPGIYRGIVLKTCILAVLKTLFVEPVLFTLVNGGQVCLGTMALTAIYLLVGLSRMKWA